MSENMIKDVTIYTIVHPDTQEEGIAGVITTQGVHPLIAVDEETLQTLGPLAQDVANTTGLPVKRVRFLQREDGEVVEPNSDSLKSMSQVPEGDPDYEPKLSDFEGTGDGE